MVKYNATNRSRQSILALAIIVGLILYGSLYPFEFYDCLDPVGGFRDLLATWKEPSSFGDLLANVLLYFPLGLFAATALPGIASPLRIIIASLSGAVFSVSVEFAQMYDVGRVSAMSDAYANSFGTLLGAIAGTALSIDFGLQHWQNLRRRPFALFLLFCWLAYRLFPYVPVIDAHKYWHAVRPLFDGSTPTTGDLARHFASWLGIGALLESVCGPIAARTGLCVFVAAVFCLRIGIVDIALTQAEVIGGATAAVVWATWLYGLKHRIQIIGAGLAAAILIEGLEPFHFLTVARPFGWIPFLTLMDGSNWIAIPSLTAKFFLYGTLIWSLVHAGVHRISATIGTAVFVFLVHYFQRYLPGRSAEITDALLVLMAGTLIRIMDVDMSAPAARFSGDLRNSET